MLLRILLVGRQRSKRIIWFFRQLRLQLRVSIIVLMTITLLMRSLSPESYRLRRSGCRSTHYDRLYTLNALYFIIENVNVTHYYLIKGHRYAFSITISDSVSDLRERSIAFCRARGPSFDFSLFIIRVY